MVAEWWRGLVGVAAVTVVSGVCNCGYAPGKDDAIGPEEDIFPDCESAVSIIVFLVDIRCLTWSFSSDIDNA